MAIASRPVAPAVGAIRMNETSMMVEIYDGANWTTPHLTQPLPKTWQDWLKRYATDMGQQMTLRRDYIYTSMQARFPGCYDVVHVAGAWSLVFANPADETWFHLQHD